MAFLRFSQDARGDFTARVRPHLPRLQRLSLQLTGGQSGDACDLVQESLARVWARWDHLQPDTRVAAYLARTVVHTYLSQQRHHRVVQRSHAENDMNDHLLDPNRRSDMVHPEHQWLKHRFSPMVTGALAKLPEPYRDVLLLVDIDGLTYREVAERLSIPIGTVMSRLHRARRHLRVVLADLRPHPVATPKMASA